MGSEKRTAWWKQVKEAICAKKTVSRAWLTNKSSEQLRLQYSTACKTAATIVKQSKEKSWEEIGTKVGCRLQISKHSILENHISFVQQTNTSCLFH